MLNNYGEIDRIIYIILSLVNYIIRKLSEYNLGSNGRIRVRLYIIKLLNQSAKNANKINCNILLKDQYFNSRFIYRNIYIYIFVS